MCVRGNGGRLGAYVVGKGVGCLYVWGEMSLFMCLGGGGDACLWVVGVRRLFDSLCVVDCFCVCFLYILWCLCVCAYVFVSVCVPAWLHGLLTLSPPQKKITRTFFSKMSVTRNFA